MEDRELTRLLIGGITKRELLERIPEPPSLVVQALGLDDLQRQLKEAQTFIDVNKEKYEKDRAAFEKEQAKARERLEKANK